MNYRNKTARLILAAAAALMTVSCTSSETDQGKKKDGSSGFLDILYNAADNKAEARTDYSALSTEKHGYGQGVQTDKDNRPAGAVDFNNTFGKYNAEAIGSADSKTIRLTFDQGYENGYTAKILDTLKAENVKATFFLLDDYARRNPELVRRMINEGHTVGNHSVTHRSMPLLTADECREEIMGMQKYIADEFGVTMTEFRPPMGEFSELSLAVTKDCGLKTVLWSFAYADWDPENQPDPKQALEKLTGALHNGAIYLLHSVSETNAKILGDFIRSAKEQGYVFA